MSEITREELAAFTDASTKSAVALEKVSASLEQIAENQSKCAETTAATIEEKLKNSQMAKDIEHTKWLVGTVGFVVIIAAVILRVIGSNISSNSNDQQIKVIEHLLQEHSISDIKQDQGVTSGKPIQRYVQPQ
jgi:uncharacterized membrane protein